MPKRVLLSDAKVRSVREAWRGPLTRAQVARRFAISEKIVRIIWDKAIDDGVLPLTPRPHFVARCKPVEPAEVIADDDSPIAEPNPRFDAQCSAALDALCRHHPELVDRSAAMCAPAEWLAFDRKGAVPPSHAQLMAMCRDYDARPRPIMRALPALETA